jgi:hypothetical protein
MTDDDAWALEERFWLEGSTVYGAHLDPECLMAFPGIGVLRSADIIAGMKGAPRWESVNMTDRHVGRPGTNLLVLGYTGEGHRSGAEPYRFFCTSTYRFDAGAWKLFQHQQTSTS